MSISIRVAIAALAVLVLASLSAFAVGRAMAPDRAPYVPVRGMHVGYDGGYGPHHDRAPDDDMRRWMDRNGMGPGMAYGHHQRGYGPMGPWRDSDD